MDSSKIPEGSEECSSSESGWTMYIASPDNEQDRADDEDDDEGYVGVSGHGSKKDDDGDVDSDDSMASDASSGPSVQRKHLYGDHRGGSAFGHAGTRDEIKCDDEGKFNQQEEKKKHHEKMKAATDKSGHQANSASRSKKM